MASGEEGEAPLRDPQREADRAYALVVLQRFGAVELSPRLGSATALWRAAAASESRSGTL